MPNDTREIELTPEFVGKSDADIHTIASLSALAEQMGGKLVLSGGYATEALCGGRITRPHGDIDARFIFKENVDGKNVFPGIESVLSLEETRWKIIKTGSMKREYIEDDETKSYFGKRRLEVGIPLPWTYDVNFDEAMLIDSNGGAVAVTVIGYEDLLASKIKKLYEVRSGVDVAKDRHPSATDYADIRRLVLLDRYDRMGVFARLVKQARSQDNAQKSWDHVASLGVDLNG